jgi:para-aminobenzoate synthetase component 1
MELTSFSQNLNTWSRDRVPFLFVIDFEMKKPFACRMKDVEAENIFYDFQGFTNSSSSGRGLDSSLKKDPITFEEYQHKFDEVFQHLSHGDSFLTNLTIRTKIESSHSLKELFGIARAKYKLLFKDQFLVFSPETFIRIGENKIITFPMKGTINAAVPDAGQTLLNNKKELAEHVTIVDLLRNDLSQVAVNVVVKRFKYLEKVTTSENDLWQMSSEISGDLPSDYRNTLGDLLMMLLPAGSVSGAPKVKTVEIIKKAEGQPRGFYTGVFGYFDGTTLDSGVMIRFIEKEKDQLYYRSGGGITTQSIAASEYLEAIDKIYVPFD